MSATQPRLRLVLQPVTPTTDGALLARVAAGDLGALGRLYDLHAAVLLRFARRLGAREDAEDVVQTVFLRVVRLAASFDPGAPCARAWMFAIAFRVVQERRRSLRRLATAIKNLTVQHRAPANVGTPSQRDLEQCLSRLSLAKRSVVVLAEIEGFSCEEIASMLEVPIGTVWTRLHHARRELRAAWGEAP